MAKKNKLIVEYSNKELFEKLEEIHVLAANINGRVRMHTKAIIGLSGMGIGAFAYLMTQIIKIIIKIGGN